MDNLSARKVKGIREAIEDIKARLHVGVQQNPPIVAAPGQQLADSGVTDLDDGGFVVLQIGAARCLQAPGHEIPARLQQGFGAYQAPDLFGAKWKLVLRFGHDAHLPAR